MDGFAGVTHPSSHVVTMSEVPSGLTGRVKRVFDLLLAIPTLIAILPLLAAIAIAIKLEDGGPVLFRHRRCGKGGRPFMILKFRTMRQTADKDLEDLLKADPNARAEWDTLRKLHNDPRITRLGKFLRKSSLDELPQLFNIIRGDMSVIGPRPITDVELELYGIYAGHYEAARPGLTGLWQVSGRNETDYDTRIDLDSHYVQNWSYGLDAWILLKTVPTVLFARGAY